MEESKRCKNCSKILTRKKSDKGVLESIRDYNKRQFCNRACATKFQHQKKSESVESLDEKDNLSSDGNDKKKLSAVEFLEDVINGNNDPHLKVQAAKALLPYQNKKADQGKGIKQQRSDSAKEAAGGKFSRMAAPKLVKG